MTVKEFKQKIREVYKENQKELKKLYKFTEEEDIEYDTAYEEGYSGALGYVLQLLKEVK